MTDVSSINSGTLQQAFASVGINKSIEEIDKLAGPDGWSEQELKQLFGDQLFYDISAKDGDAGNLTGDELTKYLKEEQTQHNADKGHNRVANIFLNKVNAGVLMPVYHGDKVVEVTSDQLCAALDLDNGNEDNKKLAQEIRKHTGNWTQQELSDLLGPDVFNNIDTLFAEKKSTRHGDGFITANDIRNYFQAKVKGNDPSPFNMANGNYARVILRMEANLLPSDTTKPADLASNPDIKFGTPLHQATEQDILTIFGPDPENDGYKNEQLREKLGPLYALIAHPDGNMNGPGSFNKVNLGNYLKKYPELLNQVNKPVPQGPEGTYELKDIEASLGLPAGALNNFPGAADGKITQRQLEEFLRTKMGMNDADIAHLKGDAGSLGGENISLLELNALAFTKKDASTEVGIPPETTKDWAIKFQALAGGPPPAAGGNPAGSNPAGGPPPPVVTTLGPKEPPWTVAELGAALGLSEADLKARFPVEANDGTITDDDLKAILGAGYDLIHEAGAILDGKPLTLETVEKYSKSHAGWSQHVLEPMPPVGTPANEFTLDEVASALGLPAGSLKTELFDPDGDGKVPGAKLKELLGDKFDLINVDKRGADANQVSWIELNAYAVNNPTWAHDFASKGDQAAVAPEKKEQETNDKLLKSANAHIDNILQKLESGDIFGALMEMGEALSDLAGVRTGEATKKLQTYSKQIGDYKWAADFVTGGGFITPDPKDPNKGVVGIWNSDKSISLQSLVDQLNKNDSKNVGNPNPTDKWGPLLDPAKGGGPPKVIEGQDWMFLKSQVAQWQTANTPQPEMDKLQTEVTQASDDMVAARKRISDTVSKIKEVTDFIFR